MLSCVHLSPRLIRAAVCTQRGRSVLMFFIGKCENPPCDFARPTRFQRNFVDTSGLPSNAEMRLSLFFSYLAAYMLNGAEGKSLSYPLFTCDLQRGSESNVEGLRKSRGGFGAFWR